MNTYAIHEKDAVIFNKRAKLMKEKFNKNSNITFQFHEGIQIKRKKDTYLIFHVITDAQKGNWQAVATIVHEDGHNKVSKLMNDIELPEMYYDLLPVCQHCNTGKTRKYTVVLYNKKTKEYIQVANSCLTHYMKGVSYDAISYLASFTEFVYKLEEKRIKKENLFDSKEILLISSEVFRKYGYVKPEYADEPNLKYSSKDLVLWFYQYFHDMPLCKETKRYIEEEIQRVHFDHHSEEAKTLTDRVYNWLMNEDRSNDWIRKTKICCNLNRISMSELGTFVSVIKYSERKNNIKKNEVDRNSALPSNWVGNVGERIKIYATFFDCISNLDNSRLYKIIDQEGNVFMWRTTRRYNSQIKVVEGTIIGHNTIEGIRLTHIANAKAA